MVNNNQAEFVLMLRLDEEEKKVTKVQEELLKVAPEGTYHFSRMKPCL
jgi:hypothetical protein